MSIVIGQEALDVSALGRLILPIAEDDFATSPGATGPLRLGGRGRDDFRITATVEFHDTKDYPHYHVALWATAEPEGFTPQGDLPTVTEFFGAIVSGMENPSDAGIHVAGEHTFPRASWKGAMELPVPLPSAPSKSQGDAELTGIEVSYKDESGLERVSVSLRGTAFRVSTEFFLTEAIGPDLFATALRRSAAVGGRLFDQDTPPATNDE